MVIFLQFLFIARTPLRFILFVNKLYKSIRSFFRVMRTPTCVITSICCLLKFSSIVLNVAHKYLISSLVIGFRLRERPGRKDSTL